MEFYIGTVLWVAFTYAPRGWMVCNGDILAILDYGKLYGVIGATYGGDKTHFRLPNLAGRTVFGPTTKLGNFSWGNSGGQYDVSVPLPEHTHAARATTSGGSDDVQVFAQDEVPVESVVSGPLPGYTLANTYDAVTAGTPGIYAPENTGKKQVPLGGMDAILSPGQVSVTVGKAGTIADKIQTLPPYLILLPIICVEGHFPAR